jgi:iron complex transport system substrate-binding protein
MDHTTLPAVSRLGGPWPQMFRPQRIVSLCPSVTETIFVLGAGARLVGRSDYCCHPAEAVAAVATVGGTKAVDERAVAALAPDLIVAVREENTQAQVLALAERWPVLLLDPVDVRSALVYIRALGTVLDETAHGEALATEIEAGLAQLKARHAARADSAAPRTAYLIWRKPYMAVGAGTYIDDVMRHIGLINAAAALPGRYPSLEEPAAAGLQIDRVLAASEPFPFAERHIAELQRRFPNARVQLVDGELFGWHGARMLAACTHFLQHDLAA